jgi:hypothetical protein
LLLFSARLLLLIRSLVSDFITASLAGVVGELEKRLKTGLDEAVCIPNMSTLLSCCVIPLRKTQLLTTQYDFDVLVVMSYLIHPLVQL